MERKNITISLLYTIAGVVEAYLSISKTPSNLLMQNPLTYAAGLTLVAGILYPIMKRNRIILTIGGTSLISWILIYILIRYKFLFYLIPIVSVLSSVIMMFILIFVFSFKFKNIIYKSIILIFISFLSYLSIIFYPVHAGLSFIILYISIILLFLEKRDLVGSLSVASFLSAFHPLYSLGGIIYIIFYLLFNKNNKLFVYIILLLNIFILAMYVYVPLGVVVLLVSLILLVKYIFELSVEKLLPVFGFGVILYIASIVYGASVEVASLIFLLGSLSAMFLFILNKVSGIYKYFVAGLVSIIILAVPLMAPLSSYNCGQIPITKSEFIIINNNNYYKISTREINLISDIINTVESSILGLDDYNKTAALLVMDPEMPSRITSPGVVGNLTIRDIATNTTLSLVPNGTQFLLVPLNESVPAFFAVDTEGPYLRAAVRLRNIIFPYTLFGDNRPSPVHSVVSVNFSMPMILRLPGNGSLVIYSGVIASSFIAGGPRSEARDLAIGVEWTNVTLGVKEGYIVFPGGDAKIPSIVNHKLVDIMNTTLKMRSSNRTSYMLLNTFSLALLSEWNLSGGVEVPGEINLIVETPYGAAYTVYLFDQEGYDKLANPLILSRGVDIVIAFPEPDNIEMLNIAAPSDAVLAAREALRKNVVSGWYISKMLTNSTDSAAAALWLASHMLAKEQVQVEFECYYRPFAIVSLLSPFVAVPWIAMMFVRGSRQDL